MINPRSTLRVAHNMAITLAMLVVFGSYEVTAQQIPSDGEGLYGLACANCHGADGAGVEPSNVAFTVPTPDFGDWHPTLGTQTQTVTITAGTTPTLQFGFSS